jgi:hypothetical protein
MTALSVNGLLQANDVELGVPGFSYSDLFDAVRLRELAEIFLRRVDPRSAPFWAQPCGNISIRTAPATKKGPNPSY